MKLKTALKNGRIFTDYEILHDHVLLLDGDRITGIVKAQQIPSGYNEIDVKGANICPGLIDLQIYGTQNDLFSADLTSETLHNIENNLLKQGCTSFNLTLATNTLEVFKKAISVFKQSNPRVAIGLHLEGPFLNAQKRGAHPADLICEATIPLLEDLLNGNEGVVNMMTVAPELTSEICLKFLQDKGVLITAGHSAATFEQATKSFNHGVSAVTHLWNAMSGLHHREVGLPGATFNHDHVCASIIVDGIHVDFQAVKLSKRLLGERLFLITDAVGSSDQGIYQHILKDDHYVLPDGTLSGSAMSMLKSINNCVNKIGIPLDESIRMATLYPARLLKRGDIGVLSAGAIANVLVFDHDFQVQQVVFQGELLF